MFFHRGFFCANMKYVEVCPDLFLNFFDILKMIFWAVGAAAPMTRSGFPLATSLFFWTFAGYMPHLLTLRVSFTN